MLAVARRPDPLAALANEVGDDMSTEAVDVAAADADLSALHSEAAVVYAPGADDAAVGRLQDVVSGRFVRILVSEWSAPGAATPPARTDRVHLRLGWYKDADGTRWHTPAEVSAAALTALRTGEDGVLGRTAPWSDRPA